jgi:hypothetical protein
MLLQEQFISYLKCTVTVSHWHLSQSTISHCHHKSQMGLLSRIDLVILHQGSVAVTLAKQGASEEILQA